MTDLTQLFTDLLRVETRLYNVLDDRMRAHGLTLGQFEFLRFIQEHTPCRVYDLVRETERFKAGRERLLTGAGSYRVAIMCSEEDPVRCHRRLLVTPALVEAGVEVRHIRGDGTVVAEAELTGGPEQDTLFGQAR